MPILSMEIDRQDPEILPDGRLRMITRGHITAHPLPHEGHDELFEQCQSHQRLLAPFCGLVRTRSSHTINKTGTRLEFELHDETPPVGGIEPEEPDTPIIVGD